MADNVKTIYAADPSFSGKLQVQGPDGKKWAVPADSKLPEGYKVLAQFKHTSEYQPEGEGLVEKAFRTPQRAGVASTKQLLGQGISPQERAAQFAQTLMMGPASPTLPLDVVARINELIGGKVGPAGLLAARAYQGASPASAPQSEASFEELPVQRAADTLGKTVGDVPAAALQFGAQMIPQLATGLGGAAGGARIAEEAVGNAPAMVKALASGVGAAGENVAQSAAFAGAGAEPGNIQQTMLDTTKDPQTLALSAGMGAMHALPQARATLREATMKNEVQSLQETFAKAKQALAQQMVTSPEATQRVVIQDPVKVDPRAVVGAKPKLKKAALPGQTYEDRTVRMQEPSDVRREMNAAIQAGAPAPAAQAEAARAMEENAPNKEPTVSGRPSPIRELMAAERDAMEAKHPGHFAEDQTAVKDRAAELLNANSRRLGLAPDQLSLAMQNRELNGRKLNEANLAPPKNLRDVEQTSPGNKPPPMGEPTKYTSARAEELRRPNEGDTQLGMRLGNRLDIVGGGSGKPELHVTNVDPRTQNITRPPVDMEAPPPEIPPAHVNAMTEAARSFGRKGAEYFDRVKRELSLPENRAGSEAAYAIRQLNAAKQMNDHAVKQVFPEIRASMKGQNAVAVGDTVRKLRDLMDNVKVADPAELERAANTAGVLEASLPDAFRENYAKVKAANQEMLKYLIDRGWLSEEASRDAALKQQLGIPWLHREYLSILDKSWEPPKDAMSKAIDELIRRNKSLSPEIARQQLDYFLKEFKGEVAKGKSFRDAFLRAGAGNDALKARTMPEWLRPVLGVINDPAFVVAQSFGELNRMYHQALVTDAMTKPEFKGKVWADKPALNMHPERLGEGTETHEAKKMYGEFAGKYVTPEVHEALHDVSGPVVNGLMHEMASGFVNLFRASKVLTSPTTIVRNFLGNFMYQMAAGISPHRWPLLFTRAVRSMDDWGRHGQPIVSSEGQPGMAKWTQMAIEDGALRPGRGYDVQGSELRHLAKYVIDRPDAGALKPMFDTYGKFINKLGGVYSVMDDVHRLMAYMHTVETGLGMGMSDAQARARASATVNRYFASGASVGPAFKKLGNYGAGFVNPFLSFQVDNARVFKNVVQDATKGQLGPLIRVALGTGSIYGLASMLRTAYGVSDQDIASAEVARTPYMTENNPFPLYLPWRSEHGYLHMANTEALNPFYMYLKGGGDAKDPKNLAARIGTNLVLGLVNSGMIEPTVKGMLAKAGAPASTTYNENVLPSQEGMAALQSGWDTLKPTLFKQFLDTMRKAQLSGTLRQGEEPLSPYEAAAKMPAGLMDVAGIEKVGPRTLDSATAARNAEMAQLQKVNQNATKQVRQGNIDVPELNKNFSITNQRSKVIMERSAEMAKQGQKAKKK